MKSITVDNKDAGQRLDKYLARRFPDCGKSLIYKFLRKKYIRLNGARAEGSSLIASGDVIELRLSDDTIDKLFGGVGEVSGGPISPISPGSAAGAPRQAQFPGLSEVCTIVYEDEDIIVADKRAGVLSQKARPEDTSLNEVLLSYCGGRTESGFMPSVCNRLDRNTTGLISFAKTYPAARELSRLLHDRACEKYYLAVVRGDMSSMRLSAWLRKDERDNRVTILDHEEPGAVHIETGYDPVRTIMHGGERLSLIRVRLYTGRTHQIRAHLSYLGHPIVGDPKYGDRKADRRLRAELGIDRQLLHAYELRMPKEGIAYLTRLSGMCFRAELPEDMKRLFG